ncbi:SMI1/KNR4 family protein [Burkholderia sp. BKH01]|uniref:SMI1/KNR4 family protein n=1 Tax=Burkholderia sp. BKH01 TaxID=2769262 RepID=UPI0021DFAE92|nr:SMI1/KNR4 family protein [Burkholderia sp. BKH01]MCU9953414.1 SMI1/KNR4 family protein [Burkholderia sp. BKH01]
MDEHANFPAWLQQTYERCRRAVPGAMQSETVSIECAISRVAAVDVIAPDNVPAVPLAAFEGYALRASDTASATRHTPVELDSTPGWRMLTSHTSSPADRTVGARGTVDIPAYFPLPENTDAIAPKSGHQITYQGARSYLRLEAPIVRGNHVIAPGSEYRKGDVLLPKGERITVERQVALIAAGVREISVTKRLRIGVVIVGYDCAPPGAANAPWQRPDTSGPYIRATLQRWGYDVPPVEYLDPPDMVQPSVDLQQSEYAFKVKLVELAQRYDLIVGAGLPAVPPFHSRGLNARPMYSNDETTVEIRQSPAGRFNFGRSDDRSPPKRTTVALTGPDGTQRGTRTLTFYDQATLVNLPGHTSAVAMLMHMVVSHVLDLLEHAAMPGPAWEAGAITHDVECAANVNGMHWGNLSHDTRGEPQVRLLPFQGDGPLRGVAHADVLVAIPAAEHPLPAGSSVLFLRLDRVHPDALSSHAATIAVDPVSQPLPEDDARTVTHDPDVAHDDLCEIWKRFDDALAIDFSRLPGGLNGPASNDEIAALRAALGTALPDTFVDSLRIHNGQADPGDGFSENDALLSSHEIIAQWTIWKGLVDGGDFDGVMSEPDPGIRDDWYNLKWIPFTHDGSGNHLCLDLDPAEGGAVGQVIRVWHDDDRRERIAKSFPEWLARTAAKWSSR